MTMVWSGPLGKVTAAERSAGVPTVGAGRRGRDRRDPPSLDARLAELDRTYT